MMVRRKRFMYGILLSFFCCLFVFLQGCLPVYTEEKESSPAVSAVSVPSAPEEDFSSEQETVVSVTYTMEDIKRLENTENLAKNTLEHIFDGTINGKGKATGYHYTLVSDSRGHIVENTRSKPDQNGVFTGKVEVSGVRKNGFSSFYPESWSPQQVVDAINIAYEDALADEKNPHGALWIGHCGDIEIDMYFNNEGKITTAYPVYQK